MGIKTIAIDTGLPGSHPVLRLRAMTTTRTAKF
jgi:hypothetical protein